MSCHFALFLFPYYAYTIAHLYSVVNLFLSKISNIDLVIANAGYGFVDRVHKGDPTELNKVIDVNVNGVINTVVPFMPSMIKNDKGHIAIIGSVASHFAWPGAGAYAASKHALRGFLETLSMECTDEITILEAVLGWVRGTNLRGNSFKSDGGKHKETKRKHSDQSVNVAFCVEGIIKGIKKDKKTIYIPKKLGFIPFLNTFFKNFLKRKIIKEINKNKE